MTSPAKVVFLGLDAADKDLIFRWCEDGFLPNIEAFRKESLWGLTANPPGLYSGAVWPSFYTGISPARHGRYFHTQLRRGTYKTYDFRTSDLKCEPFWNPLSRAGRRLCIIDVPKAPPSKKLSGIQVCDWGTHDPEFSSLRCFPPSLVSEVTSRFGKDPVGLCDVPESRAEDFLNLRDRLLERIEKKAELARFFLDEGVWDLLLIVFADSHCAGHQLWHLHDSKHPMHDRAIVETVGDPLRDIYVALDRAIGSILESVSDDAVVFLFSSHGMGPHFDGTTLLDDILRRLEGASAKGRARVEVLKAAWTRLPGGLRRILNPVRERFKSPIRESLLSSDRGARNCFAVPTNDNCGGIRINLFGREPDGRINPGSEFDTFCGELRSDLLNLVNLDTGKPAVKEVLRSADVFEGDCLDDLPDLLVRWNREEPIVSVGSSKIGKIEPEPGRVETDTLYQAKRNGDHRSNGIFFARGPNIVPNERSTPVSVMDFAPTIASLLGEELAGVDGSPIEGICSDESTNGPRVS